MAAKWKKGRGKLGFLQPLLGNWSAQADTPMGPVSCTRSFTPFGGSYVQLAASWQFGASGEGLNYREIAMIGVGEDGNVGFWSFTSDGKCSQGTVTDVSDLHPEAIGFVAQMPAGTARMAYWPDDADGYFWVVESKTKKGWNRMVHHHYSRVTE